MDIIKLRFMVYLLPDKIFNNLLFVIISILSTTTIFIWIILTIFNLSNIRLIYIYLYQRDCDYVICKHI